VRYRILPSTSQLVTLQEAHWTRPDFAPKRQTEQAKSLRSLTNRDLVITERSASHDLIPLQKEHNS
jgi:hypothetical protein